MSQGRQRCTPRRPARVAVLLLDPAWRRALPRPAGWARAVARAALVAGDRPVARLTLALADDARVRDLNVRFLGQDKPTNVLSFPAGDDGDGLGDIILARETVLAEAGAQGKPLAHHVAHLVAHGVLHLIGHDHGTASQASRMERLERRILAGFGIPDPYLLPVKAGSRAA